MKLFIAKKFSPYLYGRLRGDGKFSGEVFREGTLFPAFERARQNNDTLEVSLDGVKILGTSFLEEAFGGLVKKLTEKGVNFDLIEKTVKITSETPEYDYYIKETMKYMKNAAPEAESSGEIS